MNKFDIGEKVRAKDNGKIGEIKAYKIEGYTLKGFKKQVISYQINFGSYINEWYKEDELESTALYEFNNKFEQGLADLMININLDSKNLHMVRNFYNVKQSYSN